MRILNLLSLERKDLAKNLNKRNILKELIVENP